MPHGFRWIHSFAEITSTGTETRPDTIAGRRLRRAPPPRRRAVEGPRASKHHPTFTPLRSFPFQPSAARSPDARLEQEVARALEADARLEERLERVALAPERVHDVRAGLHERRLEHVREQREHRVERLERARLRARGGGAVLHAREQLGEDRQVEDERRREQRVL